MPNLGIVLYMLHLAGGGGDIACVDCLPEAKRERQHELVSVARINDPNEQCVYCGVAAAA